STVSGGSITFNAHSNGIILLEQASPSTQPLLTVSPESSHDPNSITMTASAADPQGLSTTIYYTTDASLSTSNLSAWTVYTGAVTFTSDAEVRVIAENSEGILSNLVLRNYQIGEIDGFTVYFKKPANWSAAPRVYYWGEQPLNALTDISWPGATMQSDGGDWYKYTFTGITSTNLIFNNNGSPQTADLTRSADGWYADGAWLDSDPRVPVNEPPVVNATPTGGSFTSGNPVSVTLSASDDSGVAPEIYYTLDGSTPSDASSLYTSALSISQTTTLKVIAYDNQDFASSIGTYNFTFSQPQEGLSVHFKPNGYTNPEIYFWNVTPSGQSTTWPGVTMTEESGGWYTYTLSNADCANLIFSNNGASQTSDLNRCEEGWYMNGTWYNTNPDEGGGTDENLDIYYKGSLATPYIYFWNVTPSGQTTVWPGHAMTSTGDGWFKYTLTGAECANIIFSNNGSNQTADLYRCGDGWYNNGVWSSAMPSGRLVQDREQEQASNEDFELTNFPNPVSSETTFTFTLPGSEKVSLKIYNMFGKEIVTLTNKVYKEGKHTISFNRSGLSPGVYIYKLNVENRSIQRKVIIE
ncbi:MAG TPA: starch-binding protein, partial [Cytophagales bacterium]|nr:starch-binding protein [Cytophagales bacterium]